MDTNQTNAGEVTVGETIDATQTTEVGGGGCLADAAEPGLIIGAYENIIEAVVHIAERVRG